MADNPDEAAVLLPAWGAVSSKYLDVVTGWMKAEPPPKSLTDDVPIAFTLQIGRPVEPTMGGTAKNGHQEPASEGQLSLPPGRKPTPAKGDVIEGRPVERRP
jgi:hypothetical protein